MSAISVMQKFSVVTPSTPGSPRPAGLNGPRQSQRRASVSSTTSHRAPSDSGNPPKTKTEEPPEYTNNRIYVSNIPFAFRENDLAELFQPFGQVVSAMIVSNERGSKGFGFVTMDSVESCERARLQLHGQKVLGRTIEVRKATCPPKVAPRPTASSPYVGGSPAVFNGQPPMVQYPMLNGQHLIEQQRQAQVMNILLQNNPMLLQSLLAPSVQQPPMMPMMGMCAPPMPYYQPFVLPATPTSFPAAQPVFPATPTTARHGYLNSGVQLQQNHYTFEGAQSMAPFGYSGMFKIEPQQQTDPASLNNSILNGSMIAHTRMMQDQLVNMLNLDGTLNTTAYFGADMSNGRSSSAASASRSLNSNSFESSDESRSSRKRTAREGRSDYKVSRN